MTLAEALAVLRSPHTVRARCHQILEHGLADSLAHFAVDLARLPDAARYVADVTRARYPDLAIPTHSRLRHFDAGDVPRLARLYDALAAYDSHERARVLIDIVIPSVLLDAGAGTEWRYYEPEHGKTLTRSEGLAVASLAWLRAGGLSGRGAPYHVDATGLLAVDEAALAAAFQVRADNPLVGVAGRVHLMRALGHALRARPEVFGEEARPGRLFDVLYTQANARPLAAEHILEQVLLWFGDIWPGRVSLEGVGLGDVWPHRAAAGEQLGRGLVPFHKLSQWLTYSLLGPLELGGVPVQQLEALTGLAEYRNGGLFLDTGVLVAKHPALRSGAHDLASEPIVEWRALTVALLDQLLPFVRTELACPNLSLASLLEGGTWAAGRKLAQTQRGGRPPLDLRSDGTVF